MVSPVLGTVRKRHVLSGFELLETAHKAGDWLPPHAHPHAYMTVIVRGTYTEGCRGQEDFCSPKSVRFLPAHEKHTNRFNEPTFCLNAELSPKFVERYAKSATTRVAEQRSPFACLMAQRLYAELSYQDNLMELGVLSAIIDLFSLFAWRNRCAETWPAPWLLRVRDYIEVHCKNAIRLDELSTIAKRHPAHLSSEFRRFFGKTISQFIRERRVLQAAEMLRSGSANVSEIAMTCGFYDQSHFTHAFQRMMGSTPVQYRSMRRPL